MKKAGFIVLFLCTQIAWAMDSIPPIRIGLLLPLQADVVKRDKSMDRFADFYTGALMAVYQQQIKGMKVEVHTYDVGKSVHQLTEVLTNDTMLGQMDMIIGPAYSSQVKAMAKWSEEKEVLTLVPFVSEVPELSYSSYLLQFNPSELADAQTVVNELIEESGSVCFVFVEADETMIPSSVHELKQCVREAAIDYSYVTVSQIMHDSLGYMLNDTKENILVMNTERYANLRQVMPYLERASQGNKLTLLSRYVWQSEPIIMEQIYPTVFRKEVDMDLVEYTALYYRFVKKERVHTLPCYDLLGYDLMSYVLETAMLLRAQSQLELEDVEIDESTDEVIGRVFRGVQSDIHFERVSELGGFQNTCIQIIRVR